MTEDEMVGWHHRLNEQEFEQAQGVGDGQGSLACCSPWGRKESDTTEGLNKCSPSEWPGHSTASVQAEGSCDLVSLPFQSDSENKPCWEWSVSL